MTQTGRTNRKTTASKPLLSPSKTIEDHATGLGAKTNITNLNTARKTLSTHGLNLPTAGNTLLPISAALFEFSAMANLGATHTEIIRAFAFTIYEAQKDIDTKNIIAKVKDLLGGPVATLDLKVDTLEEMMEKHKKEMEDTVKEVRNNIQESVEELVKAAKNTDQSPPHQCQPQETRSTSASNRPRTYAAAVKTNTSPLLTKALAKSEAQAHQILIDRRSQLYPNMLRDLTEAQLVAKATMAIELMSKEENDIPEGTMFLSARRLPHGGVLYELNSADSTAWFDDPAHRSKFLEHFSIKVVIKDRSYHVIIENVPISFTPDNHAAIADVEKKAGLKPKSILKARYIKPIARRNPGQRTAHVILTFSAKEGANQAIRFGLSIEGKKVYGRKLIQEPTICLKCHSFDGTHIATSCPQEHDSCSTCNEQHRTAECTITDQNHFKCKNCDEKGHTTWSRQCPTFISKWESHRSRNEEAKYRFYLTEDPLTWESLTNPDQEETNTVAKPPHQQQPYHEEHPTPPNRN